MKYLCLGYLDDPKKWDAMSKAEQDAFLEQCFAYQDVLRSNGHFVRGEALHAGGSVATLRFRNGKVSITDGPFIETKEVLGGLFVLEADDLEHACDLMAKHPGVRMGPFEILPIDEEFTALANARRP